MVYTLPWASGRVVLCHWSAQQLQCADKQSGRLTIKMLRKGCDVPEHLHRTHLSSAYCISLCLCLFGSRRVVSGPRPSQVARSPDLQGKSEWVYSNRSLAENTPLKFNLSIAGTEAPVTESKLWVKPNIRCNDYDSNSFLFLLKIPKERGEKLKKPLTVLYSTLSCHCKLNTTKHKPHISQAVFVWQQVSV